jgi:hypothetical protein
MMDLILAAEITTNLISLLFDNPGSHIFTIHTCCAFDPEGGLPRRRRFDPRTIRDLAFLNRSYGNRFDAPLNPNTIPEAHYHRPSIGALSK